MIAKDIKLEAGMGKIKTVTMLLLLLTLSVVVMPVKMPTTRALVPASIQGYIIDKSYEAYTQQIKTDGKVYAVEVNTGATTTVYVSANNGSYKFTDLLPGTYQLTASAGYYWATDYAYVNTTLPYKVTVTEGTNLTNINIPLDRGCKLGGFLRYIDAGSLQPIRAIAGNPRLRAAGITWLNYTVEAYDMKGRLMGAYNSSFQALTANDATTSPFTITGTRYAGLDVGTYQLKPLVFGYVNRTKPIFTATALGTAYSSIYIDTYTGGVISGTIAFVNPQGFPESPRTATDAAGAIYGGNIAVNVFDTSGALRGAYIHKWTASTLYAHQETITIGSDTYYLLKYDSGEKAGPTLSVDISTTGRKLWGRFVYQLTGVSSIPASTWTFYYRAWCPTGGTAHCDVDLIIRKSDGTIRETRATHVAISGNLLVTEQTLFVNYDWADYTVVDQTDYLEIDYYCDVTTPHSNAYAYLKIDDNTLPLTDQTRVININPLADDMSTTLRFYVLGFSDLYNKTYTSRGYKDYGLLDGLYMVRVSIRGYLQKGIVTDTATILNGGNATIRVTMTRGGAIITTIYSMSGDSHIPWQYPSWPNVLRVSVYGVGLIDVGIQDSSRDRFIMRFCGLDYSVSALQSGYLPYGLYDGTYKLTVLTYGYVQPTDVYATIVSGSKADTVILAQLGCKISVRVIFKTQDIPTPLLEDVSIYVGAFDASGALKGYVSWSATAGSSYSTFPICGYGYYPEYGLDAGTYTLKLISCYGTTVKYMQVTNVTVTLAKLGSTIENVEITVHEMGRVYGTIKTYGALGELVPLSGVKVRTVSDAAVIEYTSGADGNYSLNLPVNRTNVNQPIKYNVTFGKYYFINQTIPVETYSGAKTYLNIILVEVPEFPIGPTITLTLAYGLISWLLYRLKKGAKLARIFRKKSPA